RAKIEAFESEKYCSSYDGIEKSLIDDTFAAASSLGGLNRVKSLMSGKGDLKLSLF
ncbi:hypothetical protein L195_g049483, partial [Trifolium pratense]